MEGFGEAYTVLLALSGIVGAYVLLLFAHRRIPRAPAPLDLAALQEAHLDLAEQFAEFVETHERSMGRHHAQVGHLRRKLRRLREEEGLDPEDDDTLPGPPEETPAAVVSLPSRDEQKRQVRQAMAQRRGVA